MWRRDRVEPAIVRMGRQGVELWRGTVGQLRRSAAAPLVGAGRASPEALVEALRQAIGDGPHQPMTLLLESAVSPVIHADTGGVLWKPSQVEALVRHRLERLYRDAADPVAHWKIRLDHVPGQRHAVGFGLPRRVEEVLLTFARERGFEWQAMLPAWAWARQALRPYKAFRAPQGWWILCEQDRDIVARWDGGGWTAFNPAAGQCTNAGTALETVRREGLRHGVPDNDDRVAVAHWGALSAIPGGARLFTLPIADTAVGAGQPVSTKEAVPA